MARLSRSVTVSPRHLGKDDTPNTSLFYTKKHTTPQRNLVALHDLYEGLWLLLSVDVIRHGEFIRCLRR